MSNVTETVRVTNQFGESLCDHCQIRWTHVGHSQVLRVICQWCGSYGLHGDGYTVGNGECLEGKNCSHLRHNGGCQCTRCTRYLKTLVND